MMKAEEFFPPAEKERLASAIRDAETKTSGEIVPYVVGRSDAYPEAPWRAGALGAMLALFYFSMSDIIFSEWAKFSIAQIGLFTVAAGIAGAGLVLIFSSLALLFVPQHAVERRVNDRAKRAFLDEKIFLTHERTGILIFLSLLERRVVVLSDEGINARVKQDAWNGIVATIVGGIQAKRPAEGLLKAIVACGTLLESASIARGADDTNERSDTIRIHES